MADERTGIKYIGKEPHYKDRIFGTGLVWKSGEALPLAVEVAKEFLKHPTLFQEVKGLTPLMGSTSSSGGVVLSAPLGNIGIPGSSIESPKKGLPCWEILECFNIYDWGRDASSGLTIEIDESVRWQNRPTVKITIPAGQSGGKYIFGTNTYSTAKFPVDFDGNNLAIVASVSDTSKIFNGVINFEYGDATMTNRWTQPVLFSGYGPSDWVRNNEWAVLKPNDGTRTVTGSPTIAQRMRARGQITIVGTLTDPLVIRVAMIGIMRKQKKPIVGWTLDDWDAGWWKYYWPVARYYEIPTTIQLCAGAETILDVDRNNIRAMREDPNRLVSFANHARLHKRYKVDAGAVTPAEMLALYTSNETNVADLGGSLFEQKFASYPNGAYDQALIDALIGAGYYGARGTENLEPQQKTGMIGVGDRAVFQLPLITQVNETLTAQQTIDALTAWIPGCRFGTCLSHHIGLVDASQVADVRKLEAVFKWLRDQADAGALELTSMIRHCAEALNVPTDRR